MSDLRAELRPPRARSRGTSAGSVTRTTRVAIRTFDIVGGALIALAVTPIVVVLALASAFSLRAWPFFVQDRPGRAGRSVRLVKIRTLPPSTPHYAHKHHLDFSRTPRLMQQLRRLHLDELPQLWQVPMGALSLVGPRPRQRDDVDALDPTFDSVRREVRPGCTGLWQISPASTEGLGVSPEYDLFWVGHRTLRLTVWALARTVLVMTGIGRPVTLEDVPDWALPRLRYVDIADRPMAIATESLEASAPAA